MPDIKDMVSAFIEGRVLTDYRLLRPIIVCYAKSRREIRDGDPWDAVDLARKAAQNVAEVIGLTSSKLSLNNQSDTQTVRDVIQKIEPQLKALDNFIGSFANSLNHMKSSVAKGEHQLNQAVKEKKRLHEILKDLAQLPEQ